VCQENHFKTLPSSQRHVAGAILLIWKQALLSAGLPVKMKILKIHVSYKFETDRKAHLKTKDNRCD